MTSSLSPRLPEPVSTVEPRLHLGMTPGKVRADVVVPPESTSPSSLRVAMAFLAVTLLAVLDAIEHIPAMAVYLTETARIYGVFDLLALGVIFWAARSFRIPFDGMTLDEVLNRADAAMYRAKARGGNRAESYSD